MKINQANWKAYVQKLSSISKTAGNKLQTWIDVNGLDDMPALINYAIALSDKYGEAGASLAAEMYDEVAQLSNVSVPFAEVANTATYGEVAKAMYGTVKEKQKPSATMERLVKQASADTMQKNAIRDGAQWAWIPSGDSCAFCITLASRGWQKASKKTLKGDHCDHIHAHCDCQFMIRFNRDTNVEGYNPQEYRRIYDNAEGTKPKDKINTIRRMQYQAQKRKISIDDAELPNGLPYNGKPNTIIDRVVNGTVIQRREYDINGEPEMDIDTSDHGMPKKHPTGAHKHSWNKDSNADYKKRSIPYPLTEEEITENDDIIKVGINYNEN